MVDNNGGNTAFSYAEPLTAVESQRLQKLVAYLQSVREKERIRVADIVHDDIGQSLAALKFDLFRVRTKLPNDQPDLASKIESISDLLESVIRRVKDLSAELMPGLLDDLGLSPAIEWLAEDFRGRTGVACRVDLELEDISMDINHTMALYRILQESLDNIHRHARATEVRIRFRMERGK